MSKLDRSVLADVVSDLSLDQKADLKTLCKSVAAYLLEEHRELELDSLVRDIQKSWSNKGYVDLLVRVARPLPNETIDLMADRFADIYPSAKIAVSTVVDPSIIGGASVELADQRFDITISRRLSRFTKSINAIKEVNV